MPCSCPQNSSTPRRLTPGYVTSDTGETGVTQSRRASMANKRPGSGQTVLVTGASMGIGVDLAECFAADGYDVVLTARSEPALRTLADRLAKDHGVKTTVIPGDLAEMGGGSKLAAE